MSFMDGVLRVGFFFVSGVCWGVFLFFIFSLFVCKGEMLVFIRGVVKMEVCSVYSVEVFY